MSLLNTKFFCAEASLSSTKHSNIWGKDLDAYVRRFYKRDLDYCVPNVEEVVVDVYLHSMMEEYRILWKIFLSIFFQVDGSS